MVDVVTPTATAYPDSDKVGIWTGDKAEDVMVDRSSQRRLLPRRDRGAAMTQHEKAATFRALHAGEPFVIPNPWDAGSARVLEALGFQALATTSSGFAFTLGRLDGNVDARRGRRARGALDRGHRACRSRSTSRTATAPSPSDAATAIARAPRRERSAARSRTATRAAPLPARRTPSSASRPPSRRRAALDFPFTLTARAENHIRGNPDLDDTIARLQAYERAGADVLYAPGLRTAEEIRAVCDAVSKPVNVLAPPRLTMDEIVAAGAQRVSVGGSLAWVAVAAFAGAAEQMRDSGDFSCSRVPVKLDEWLGD